MEGFAPDGDCVIRAGERVTSTLSTDFMHPESDK